MTLRLNGSTSGYVEIDAPATAGSNTLVLPTGNGSNGQYLQTNGSGALSWANAGKILQVVSTTKTDVFSSSSSSFVDVTGLSVNITPSSTSNKVLVLVNAWVGSDTQTANVYFELRRDTTTIQSDTVIRIPQEAQSVYRMYNLAFMYLDTPSSTSTLAYSVRARTNAGTMYINRPGNQGGFPDVADSSITVIEVKG